MAISNDQLIFSVFDRQHATNCGGYFERCRDFFRYSQCCTCIDFLCAHFDWYASYFLRCPSNFNVSLGISSSRKKTLAGFFSPLENGSTILRGFPIKSSYNVVWCDAPCFICQALLHFMYWDSLPDMEELTGTNAKWASTLMGQHLLVAADRYAMERLRLLCEANLCEDVAINTVATTLALAEQHHCFQLKAVCLKFIALPENLRGKSSPFFFFFLFFIAFV